MWYYMVSCYLFSFLTFLLLLLAFFQSFMNFSVFEAAHSTFMILTSIVYLFTETLVIFFFVGTGMGIKEFAIEKKLDPEFRLRSIAIKKKVFPPLLLNLLLMMALFILVGAVVTHRFPPWLYTLIFLGCLFHLGKSKIIQNRHAKETVELFREMAGLKKE